MLDEVTGAQAQAQDVEDAAVDRSLVVGARPAVTAGRPSARYSAADMRITASFPNGTGWRRPAWMARRA